MAWFGKKEIVFEVQGNKPLWNKAKELLREKSIPIAEALSREGELPLCSCGAQIDRRNYGPNGWIDRRIYYIAVHPEYADAARQVLTSLIGNTKDGYAKQ